MKAFSLVLVRLLFLSTLAFATACTSSKPEDQTTTTDSDGDGVVDASDACPGTAAGATVDASGCPVVTATDDDGDGVNNDADSCPGTPAGTAVDATGCPVSTDDDGDGVNNDVDACPDTPTGATVDATGCPVTTSTDDDGDGVNNDVDACPGTPAGTTVDATGCPVVVSMDADGDGVNDDIDACPGTPAGATVDATGCEIVPEPVTRNRYKLNNQCFAIQSVGNGNFVVASGGSYTASEADLANASPFFMKPSSLGSYMVYDNNGQVINISNPLSPSIAATDLQAAAETSLWSLRGNGDSTDYPAEFAYHEEPTPQQVNDYRAFVDPNEEYDQFTLTGNNGQNLVIDGSGNLALAGAGVAGNNELFSFYVNMDCNGFPEASSNVVGESPHTLPATSFSGQTADGRILGTVDAHVHVSATEFLAQTEWGRPFHPNGVTHALDQCDEFHGPAGEQDAVGALFSGDMGGHDTTGWPTFPFWPGRDLLTHEAIYWKWLERSWQSGLRVIVNDVVDNETLCELNRNLRNDPAYDCNPMNNAMRQVSTMYGMMDYIDAQYGGRGEGWYRIVHDSSEARAVIEDGKAAVVLGIEISNLLGCQLTYNPLRTQQAHEETGTGPNENSYGCAMTETGADNEIVTQLNRLWDVGIRQIISIHEFDNAFGGNGIFDGQVLNLGNRENTGGNPGTDPNDPFSGNPTPETPTGEFWTTYACPEEGGLGTDGQPFSGYLFGSRGGSEQEFFNPEGDGSPPCTFTGQGDGIGTARPGGSTPCYPKDEQQCNARWMTPIGLYMYRKMMEYGFIFDWDHMEMEMKTQALELGEAQNPVYPFVSTHGNFGGTSVDQASRLLEGVGFIYPSIGSSRGFRNNLNELLGIYNDTFKVGTPDEITDRPLFGFGYGTDTNGLSGQTGPRDNPTIPLEYPFTLFSGGPWDQLDDFDNIDGVVFEQPAITLPDGTVTRTWHQDMDGNAHHGMIADVMHEIALEGTAEELQHIYNSAEVYLRTWAATEASSAAIQAKRDAGVNAATDGVRIPDDSELPRPLLRPAPTVSTAPSFP